MFTLICVDDFSAESKLARGSLVLCRYMVLTRYNADVTLWRWSCACAREVFECCKIVFYQSVEGMRRKKEESFLFRLSLCALWLPAMSGWFVALLRSSSSGTGVCLVGRSCLECHALPLGF